MGGGQPFQPPLADSSLIVNEQDQATLVALGQQNANVVQPLSQADFISSSSDKKFRPLPKDPSAYVFKLPNVPSNPHFPAYSSVDTFNCPVPYRSPFSSYNNPAFTVPSNQPHVFYNQAPLSPVNAPLYPPPPPPPCCPVLPSQPQFQPAYNHYPQPTYN